MVALDCIYMYMYSVPVDREEGGRELRRYAEETPPKQYKKSLAS